MPVRPLTFDLFASHAKADEKTRHVSAFLARLKAQHDAEFPAAPLTFFFDEHDIRTGADWQRTLREGVQQSRFFLAFLSPGYFASDWCRREWHAWLDHEISLHILSQGAFPIYFVEIPELTRGMSEQDIAHAIAALRDQPAPDIQRHLSQIHRRQRIVIKPFFPDGAQALREGKLDSILHTLANDIRSQSRLLDSIDPRKTTVPNYNPAFTGRRTELTQLRDALDNDLTGVITGITGLGGIGKTELAFTYAHAYAAHYPGGRWLVPCEHFVDLRQALLALDTHPLPAAELVEKETLATHFAHILKSLHTHVQQQGRTLLILDNVTDLALLTPVQTRQLTGFQGQLHLLATTRLAPSAVSSGKSGAEWLHLDRLSIPDSIELLEKHRPLAVGDTPGTAERIATLLGGYTLAIHYAALFLAEHPDTPHTALIERLIAQGLEAIEDIAQEDHPDDTYDHDEKSLGVILDFTLASLGKEQRHLLDLTALLGPDHIILEWLRPLAAQRFPEFAQPERPAEIHPWQAAITRLLTLGLLSRPEKADDPTGEASSFSTACRTHRMLQQHLLRQMPEREENQRLIDEMAAAIEKETDDLATLHARRWMLAPLQALAERWDELKHGQASWLMNNIASSWHHLSEYSLAEPLMRRALAIDEQSYGPLHPNVSRHLNNLAQLLQNTNRLAEAEPLMRRALDIDEQSSGPLHPNVARNLNNLALLLKATNRLAEAEPLMRRALDIDEQSYGPLHPDVARDLSNLAGLLQATNRLAEAEPLMRRALDIDEQSSGPLHPLVAIRLSNLAHLLQATNRLAEAEPLMRRALAIDEQSYGPLHPKVAIRLNNLAQLLQDTNRLAEAEPLMRRALDIDEQSYGPLHPDVARDLNNLAALLQATNRLAEAEPLMRRALDIDEQSYGPLHPDVARDLSNLAALLQATNRLAEAEPLMRRALDIDEQSYGPLHPDVAIRLNNLAQLLQDTNRLAEAEPLYRRALFIKLKSYAGVPGVLATVRTGVENYVIACQEMGLAEDVWMPRLLGIFREAGVSEEKTGEIFGAVFGQV